MDGNYSLIRSFTLNNISDMIAIFDQLQPKERELLRRLSKNKDLSDFLKDTKTLYFFPEYRLHKILLLYVSPLLLVLGTFGNIFSVFVMRQRSIIRMTAYVYLINLAIADSVVLYIGLLRLWISELTGMDIRNQTSWLCKLVVFCGYVSSDFSVWLIIAVTIERYIVVCHPRKVNNFCTVQRAKWVVCGLLLLFVAINIHFFWTISLNERNVDNKISYYCSSRKDFDYLVTVLWPWVDAFLYCFVPFGTILSLNTLIIRRIVALSRGTIKMQSAQSNLLQVRRCHTDSNRKLTLMLLTLSFMLLLTTLPLAVSLILAHFWNFSMSRDLAWAAKYQLTKTIAELMMYLNHSMNFILYCTMGRKFRQQVVRMFCNKNNMTKGLSDHTHHIYCSRNCSPQINTSQQCPDTEI
ncbi:thyrotropin-releasing hormone receptor [Octopus bimaculoides]|nr:thyrotropin-releasing hormone receptor [Octopus bimaculoides]